MFKLISVQALALVVLNDPPIGTRWLADHYIAQPDVDHSVEMRYATFRFRPSIQTAVL